MTHTGWQNLFQDWSWARGEGRFPIPAYSEYMPPPRIGQKPYGQWELNAPFSADDACGFVIGAGELERELQPGLANIARQLIEAMVDLATGKVAEKIGHHHLEANPYWPKALADRSAKLQHERYLFLSPLALSKTQDDKGRVRWTLFGASQKGPARGFWQSFFRAPSAERPTEESRAAILDLLRRVYEEPVTQDLAGFRILPTGTLADFPELEDGNLPAWTQAHLFRDSDAIGSIRHLLTFRPFALLPEEVQQAYFAGKLHLLPSPVSLVFWGSPHYRKLAAELPLAGQILLLQAVARHGNPRGIRVPQSGWLHHHGDSHHAGFGEEKGSYLRTHRWQRMLREEDSAKCAHEERIHKVIFSSDPKDIGLYDKPLARNTQIWSDDFRAVLDGPRASPEAIRNAIDVTESGRTFGYRFYYPPMQAGRFALFWHRPLIAFRDPGNGEIKNVETNLTGYIAASDDVDSSGEEIHLWPRFAAKIAPERAAVTNEGASGDKQTLRYAARAQEMFARHLDVPAMPEFSADKALTFQKTATRSFEVRYWKTIAKLAEGRYLNKNSADCIKDEATQARIPWHTHDLRLLGDFLLDYYRKLARDTNTDALVGEMPVRWQTDFEYRWMEGWLLNQEEIASQRNIVTVIPGRNHGEAVIMADHYDTAYMEDVFGYRSGKNDGARLAASGADDNHSATTALMLGAEAFMELSREGKLARDVWLVHLTGEEFPADCLGARNLAQKIVEGTCGLDDIHDLSKAGICGLYVLDMIAHNNDRRKDVFQIAPGPDKASLWLAYQAHIAAKMWEAGASMWNARGKRRELGRGRRSPHGAAIPLEARHLAPAGEVRFQDDPRSTLFNTDGQIFADAGIPTVLFMENYDINREGYHDTQDTMANIDLDYGAAVAAIAIESVARAASEPLP